MVQGILRAIQAQAPPEQVISARLLPHEEGAERGDAESSMKRKQPQPSDPIDLAARALRHRDRSRSQIDERLARAGVGGRSTGRCARCARAHRLRRRRAVRRAARRVAGRPRVRRRGDPGVARATAFRRSWSGLAVGALPPKPSGPRRSSRPSARRRGRLPGSRGRVRRGVGRGAAGEFAADGPRRRVPSPDYESLNPETVRFCLQSSASPIESTVPVSHDFSHLEPASTADASEREPELKSRGATRVAPGIPICECGALRADEPEEPPMLVVVAAS